MAKVDGNGPIHTPQMPGLDEDHFAESKTGKSPTLGSITEQAPSSKMKLAEFVKSSLDKGKAWVKRSISRQGSSDTPNVPTAPSQDKFEAWNNERRSQRQPVSHNPTYQKNALKAAENDVGHKLNKVHKELEKSTPRTHSYELEESRPEAFELNHKRAGAGREAEGTTNKAFDDRMQEASGSGKLNPLKHKQAMQGVMANVAHDRASSVKTDAYGDAYVQQYNGEEVTDRQLANIKRMEEASKASDAGLANLQHQAKLESVLNQMDVAQAKLDKLNQKKTNLEKLLAMIEKAVVRLSTTRVFGEVRFASDVAERMVLGLSKLATKVHAKSKLVNRRIPLQEQKIADLNTDMQKLLAPMESWIQAAREKSIRQEFEDAGFGASDFQPDVLVDTEVRIDERESLHEQLKTLFKDVPEMQELLNGLGEEVDSNLEMTDEGRSDLASVVDELEQQDEVREGNAADSGPRPEVPFKRDDRLDNGSVDMGNLDSIRFTKAGYENTENPDQPLSTESEDADLRKVDDGFTRHNGLDDSKLTFEKNGRVRFTKGNDADESSL